jgi:SAM-dependent methyltransferase
METYNSDIPKIEEFVQLGGKSLLEVGCGVGRLTARLANKAESITAVDPDERSIEAARRNITGVEFLVGSGENLHFANQTFDIVLFSYSLHHQNCVKALSEAQRVARQEGQILIIEPTPDSEYTMLVSVFEKNEISILRNTLDYITSGLFKILRRDTYGVDYPFADEDKLCSYFTANYMTQRDDRAVEKMQTIIGNKKPHRRTTIQDVVNIFLIGK